MATPDPNAPLVKPRLEDADSWSLHIGGSAASEDDVGIGAIRRRLHHHNHHKEEENEWIVAEERMQDKIAKEAKRKDKALWKKMMHKNKKNHESVLSSPGIGEDTVHGMMIDAGSTGSRLHVYEFDPRSLHDDKEIEQAVSGKKLSFPGTESRWTERLSPGLGTFASLPDEELLPAVADYLSPLIEFAKEVLRAKEEDFAQYPIFLKGTAGLRILSPGDRTRVVSAVRTLFSDPTYCPFAFENEQARVISGEEEAIYGWTSVNFLMGTLLENSEGAGTVVNPRLTYGALDLGGASTQISFYEPDGDIMSNLFKLQIGQGKHWNVYAHSYLRYGMNEAQGRMRARLVLGRTARERLEDGVYDPCLPGGSRRTFRSALHFDEKGVETLAPAADGEEDDNVYSAILTNDGPGGSWEECSAHVYEILRKDANAWCDYAHGGDCSFSDVYQPRLPLQSQRFGEFLGFSNFNHVWQFLKLPARSSLADVLSKTREVCEMSREELLDFNDGVIEEAIVEDYCFHAAYVFHLLHDGYGFPLDYHITATNVVNGHKVGWALGAMLYEINTLPWMYVGGKHHGGKRGGKIAGLPGLEQRGSSPVGYFFLFVLLAMGGLLVRLFRRRVAARARRREEYEPLKESEGIEMEYSEGASRTVLRV